MTIYATVCNAVTLVISNLYLYIACLLQTCKWKPLLQLQNCLLPLLPASDALGKQNAQRELHFSHVTIPCDAGVNNHAGP